jgi:hypothetical protein
MPDCFVIYSHSEAATGLTRARFSPFPTRFAWLVSRLPVAPKVRADNDRVITLIFDAISWDFGAFHRQI